MIRSTDREVRGLIDALAAGGTRRDAAMARLIIIGARAVARLIDVYDSTSDRQVQLAVLRVLETTGDDRALPIARRALAAGGDLAVQSVVVLRELLTRGSLAVQAQALDALVAIASDATAERRVRQAAARAIAEISRSIGPPPAGLLDESVSMSEAVWADAADGHLPDEPGILRAAAAEHAEKAPLRVVQRVIEAVRGREQAIDTSGMPNATARSREWHAVRGALHQTLALRGSRIALYDLREAVVSSIEPLPHSFLAALQTIGDESCLEPLAAAFAHAGADARWRHQLATAFQTIAKRERLNRKHSAVRRALARSPELAFF